MQVSCASAGLQPLAWTAGLQELVPSVSCKGFNPCAHLARLWLCNPYLAGGAWAASLVARIIAAKMDGYSLVMFNAWATGTRIMSEAEIEAVTATQ